MRTNFTVSNKVPQNVALTVAYAGCKLSFELKVDDKTNY